MEEETRRHEAQLSEMRLKHSAAIDGLQEQLDNSKRVRNRHGHTRYPENSFRTLQWAGFCLLSANLRSVLAPLDGSSSRSPAFSLNESMFLYFASWSWNNLQNIVQPLGIGLVTYFFTCSTSRIRDVCCLGWVAVSKRD